MSSRCGKLNKIQKLITFPFRALVKARDSYVQGMTNISARPGFKGAPSSRFSKNSSVSSSRSSVYGNDDFSELVRVASVRRMGGRLDEELTRRPPVVLAAVPASGVVPRSCSVGMGKIDENMPCEFGEEDSGGVGLVRAEMMYPRSKSYAVTKRRFAAF